MSSVPVILSVTAIDGHSVRVTWRAPAEPNGVIIGYTITYKIGRTDLTVNVPFNGETVSIEKYTEYKFKDQMDILDSVI